jgi:hypothetical protein
MPKTETYVGGLYYRAKGVSGARRSFSSFPSGDLLARRGLPHGRGTDCSDHHITAGCNAHVSVASDRWPDAYALKMRLSDCNTAECTNPFSGERR